MSGVFVTEESDHVMLVLVPESRPCSVAGCTAFARFGMSVDGKPFEMRCRNHLPYGIAQEYWTRRMLLAALDGNEGKARALLECITAEARRNGYDRCASVADVKAQEALNSTYPNQDMARGAHDMAKRIAQSIRSM